MLNRLKYLISVVKNNSFSEAAEERILGDLGTI